ncbi:Phosphatidylinositol-glycan biosynthesis class S protein [Trinorchestia longiramus]|nr:Phosphatidylinositol-glycan biosynthesis class S protein [Trinorchestia longiramus]
MSPAPDLATHIKELRRRRQIEEESDEELIPPTPTDEAGDIPVDNESTPESPAPLNVEGAWAAVGFAVVLVVVGLPVWWRTTTVYRAPLPYSAVEELSGLRRLHFIPITVLAERPADGVPFAAALKSQLKKPGPAQYRIHSRGLLKPQEVAVRGASSLTELVEDILQTTVLHSGTLTLLLLGSSALLNPHQIHVTTSNLVILAPHADVSAVASVLKAIALDVPIGKEQSVALRSSYRPPIPPPHKVVSEPHYSLTVTLMLPEPHAFHAHWQPAAAVAAYLRPLLDQLEKIQLRVSVRCQQLYMTPLSGIEPQWQQEHSHYAVLHHQLPLAINAIEAKLGSFVSTDPALHFIVYVPPREHSPLRIHASDGAPLPSNSFVVPRWGGVIIHNAPSHNSSTLAEGPLAFPLNTHFVMTTVLSQLHELLPVPRLKSTSTVSVAAMQTPELSQWQLDALARARVTQYYQSTATTLQSLHELVGEISNMVVSEEVAGRVWQSVSEWEACGEAIQEGRLREASLYCTHAHEHAHAAFFHPSMLALLYFPDNQKYAIYVPLFLPVSIPVLLSFKMLFSLAKYYLRPGSKEVKCD